VEEIDLDPQPPAAWEPWASELLGQPAAQVVIAHRTDAASAARMHDLCCALADAGHGVVAERVPVLVPPRYEVRYRGAPAALGWEEVGARALARRRAMVARGAEEQARQRAAWERQLETETDRHVLYTEIVRLAQESGDRAVVDVVLAPGWDEQASLAELRRLLREQLARARRAGSPPVPR
jgi:hypothetical protein